MSPIDPEQPPLAAIFGLASEALTNDERAFFKDADPLGFILFARNCETPEALKALAGSLQDLLGRAVPVLIDQEGGRVQRLKPPHWREYPPAKSFGDMFMRDFAAGKKALADTVGAIARDLMGAGINVNCAPVLDIRFPETHEAIGDRAFSVNPDMVAALGAATCRGYLEHGIIPVVKHMPGLGRANLDTHLELPEVSASLAEMDKADLLPYTELLDKPFSEAVWGMVSHAVYTGIDERAPASCSRRVIWDVLRQHVGFDGLLLSDDIDMHALQSYGNTGQRAEKTLRAGCDIALQCNGRLEDMQEVARRIPKMTKDAVLRYNRSVSWVRRNFKLKDRNEQTHVV